MSELFGNPEQVENSDTFELSRKNGQLPSTEEVRSYFRGSSSSRGTKFDRWLISERKRVAEMAILKENNRILALLQKTIDECDTPNTCVQCDITRYHISLLTPEPIQDERNKNER